MRMRKPPTPNNTNTLLPFAIKSPINYLIKVRLEKARVILENDTSGSIKNIANAVGYEDVYHFSKLFKKYYGFSPLNYKKRCMEKNA